MSVCKEFDAYVHNSMIDGLVTLWIAQLSNGETIYSDDYRPGETEWNAWKRLRDYVHENNLQINKLKIKYKSHEYHLPDNADGYFFGHGAKALITNKHSNRVNCYLVGPINLLEEKIDIFWLRVPEVEVEETETRKLDVTIPQVIMNIRDGQKTN